VKPLVEALRDFHRVLTGHAVGDQQDLVRMDSRLEMLQLGHHLVVDLETAGGIDDDDAVARTPRLLDARLGDAHDVLRPTLGVDGDVELLAKRLELVDRGRTIDVCGNEARRAALALELASELRGGRRLTRTWRPTIMTTVGGTELSLRPSRCSPSIAVSSS
jgi:hypothetical protein